MIDSVQTSQEDGVMVKVRRIREDGHQWQTAQAIATTPLRVSLSETIGRHPGKYFLEIDGDEDRHPGLDHSLGIDITAGELDTLIDALIALRARAVAERFSAPAACRLATADRHSIGETT